MIRRLGLIFFTLAFAMGGWSQCETEFNLSHKAYFDQLEHRGQANPNRDDVVYVPIAFHVETYGGNPVLSTTAITNAIAECNSWYAAADIVLEMCSEEVFYYENGDGYSTINNVLNVNVATSYNGCGVNYGYGPNITINPNCNRPFDEILAHEVGHALGLPHTHGYTNNGTTNELVDGSNCETAGDHFCDTPADPNLLNYINSSCVYTGTLTDANGDFYTPNTHNLMSYTYSHCPDHFSPMQCERMHDVAVGYEFNCCLLPLPLTSNVSVCREESATLVVTNPTGDVLWYEHANDDEPMDIGSSFTTEYLEETTSYYVSMLDGCETDKVKVTVDVIPAVGVLASTAVRTTAFTSSGGQGGDGGVGGFVWYQHIIPTDTLVYVVLGNNELWAFGSEPFGEYQIAALNLDGGTTITDMISLNDQLILGLNDWNSGSALWVSDGTPEGTAEIMYFDEADYAFSNYRMTPFNGGAVFAMSHEGSYTELWYTDGSSAGTQKITDLPSTSGYTDFRFTQLGSLLIFTAQDTPGNSELWRTDGTETGTYPLVDVNPANGSGASILAAIGSHVYFIADDGVNGSELWKTDAEGNASLVTEINPSGSANIANAVALGNKLYFSANDGLNGYEPWVSDGTAEGTLMIEDINPSGNSQPVSFTLCGGKVYFGASPLTGTHPDLFRYNPMSNTLQVAYDFTQEGYGGVDEIWCENDHMYFRASIGVNNLEIWRSEGTPETTYPLADINLSTSSWPTDFFTFNNEVCFVADDGVHANQFWTIEEPHYTVCEGQELTIETAPTLFTISWYDEDSEGEFLGTGATWNTGPLEETTSFYAELSQDGCLSERTEFKVTVLAITQVSAPAALCEGNQAQVELTTNSMDPDLWFSLDGEASASPFFEAVDPGAHEIMAILNDSCAVSENIQIIEALPISATTEIQMPTCHGLDNATVNLSTVGGFGSISWSVDGQQPNSEVLIDSLSAGSHYITFNDDLGCNQDTLFLEIDSPDPLDATILVTDAACDGECTGIIDIYPTGGTIQQYYITGLADTEGIWLDTGAYHMDVCAMDFIVEIFDDNGCAWSSEILSVNAAEPSMWYFDQDQDGYGDDITIIQDCVQSPGFVSQGGDCDDFNADVYPNAPGQGDGLDVNCDGQISQTETTCQGDYNFDGVVNSVDLLVLLGNIGCTSQCLLDTNGDDEVDTQELLGFLGSFGTICGN
ncbi:MAG: hypothetical protein KDC12_05075 [Flavobacteriales bacterium]|nr:hypothetical protein [Flavobacteriales bacterium]